MIEDICQKCSTCQKSKRSYKKYGKLPPKEAETVPWDTLCVDLIGPYSFMHHPTKDKIKLWAVTMIDPVTGWFEIAEIKDKFAYTIANVVETTWLTCYPWPTQIIFDRGTEFQAEFAEMITKDYGLKKKPISTRNPQANAILERIHATIGNMIRTYKTFDDESFDPSLSEPFKGILAAVMFGVRSTIHTTLQATPAQLVFGRDAILNIKFNADWNLIKQSKQTLINKNNQRENKSRKDYKYQIGQQVLIENFKDDPKFAADPWKGPYCIRQINNNGTVIVYKDSVLDTVHICRIKPYHAES